MNEASDLLWDQHQPVIREYFDSKPLLDALCSEVAFILEKRLKDAGIETASITSRVKTLKSFLNKIERKSYKKPFKQTTDLAGVRVVYLYKDDLSKIKGIVNQNFSVVEEVDKTQDDVDRFGYDALHYVVKIGRKASGARYEDLKKLVCEIQIRTILQDSWAIIDHHLRYKTESEVPRILRRKIHRLAAVLEEADEKFNEISKERTRYIEWLHDEKTTVEEILNDELNRDSLIVYLKKKFPEYSLSFGSTYKDHLSLVVDNLDFSRYRTLRDIDEIINKTAEARKLYKRKYYETSSLAHFGLSMACVDKEYREATIFNDEAWVAINFYEAQQNEPQGI